MIRMRFHLFNEVAEIENGTLRCKNRALLDLLATQLQYFRQHVTPPGPSDPYPDRTSAEMLVDLLNGEIIHDDREGEEPDNLPPDTVF